MEKETELLLVRGQLDEVGVVSGCGHSSEGWIFGHNNSIFIIPIFGVVC